MNEIDKYLREHKPAVKEDPTFLLETSRRLDAVEGIKAEVDCERSRGRVALIIALAAGLAAGVLLTLLLYLYPVHSISADGRFLEHTRLLLDSWKQYLIFPVAALAITLGLVLSKDRRKTAHL